MNPQRRASNPVIAFVDSLRLYRATDQGYQIEVPVAWEQTGKAGADALFKVPNAKYTDLGVTITPVRISRLDQLGDVDAIGQRLIATERQKVRAVPSSRFSFNHVM